MKFHKYHGLGNDYIVLDTADVDGQLQITIADDYAVTMTGPVAKVCDDMVSEEIFRQLV